MKRLKKGQRIKVLVTDDHTLFRTGIINSLKGFNEIEVIGEAGNGQELLDKLQYLSPDVITLDIQMPVMNGIVALQHITKEFPSIKVVIVSFYNDPVIIAHMMTLGANSYITNESEGEMLYKAIIECYENDYFFNKTVKDALIEVYIRETRKPKEFTKNELKILEFLSVGKSEIEIAKDLDLDPRTVQALIWKLKKKTKTHSVEALIAFGKKEKIIS